MALTELLEKPALLVRGYIIKHAACVHRDETAVIIAGKIGYAWLCWGAGRLCHRDGQQGPGRPGRLFRHARRPVRNRRVRRVRVPAGAVVPDPHTAPRRETAVRSGKGPDLIPCPPLLGMHSRVKRTETAPPGSRRDRRGRCGRSPTCTGVFRTAENRAVRPSAVARMTARGPGWDMSAHANGPGPPLGSQARRPFRAPRAPGPERPGHGL